MVGSLLLRGMLIGVVAGLLAFAFAHAFGEPQVNKSIAFEEQTAKAAGEAEEPEIVSRAVQSTLGLATGLVVFGAAVGGIFSLVFAFVYGRVGNLGCRATSALLALAAFVSIVVVPQIKYPANPPAVGSPDTIGSRTGLFFIMLVVSIAAMVAAIVLARRIWNDYGPWNAVMIAGAAFIVFIGAVDFLMPVVDEVPKNFSADVLWRFRITSLGIHAILWTVIGLAFGAFAERKLGEQPAARMKPAYR